MSDACGICGRYTSDLCWNAVQDERARLLAMLEEEEMALVIAKTRCFAQLVNGLDEPYCGCKSADQCLAQSEEYDRAVLAAVKARLEKE